MTRARPGAAPALLRPTLVCVALALLGAGCARPTLPLLLAGPVPLRACSDAAEVVDSVFLVGGAGRPLLPKHPEAELPVDPVLRSLRDEVMEQAGALGVARVAVIYLGDNVLPRGLAPVGGAGRARGERVLRQQITAAGPARVTFSAGDRDWDGGGAQGWARVRAEQGFLSIQGPRVSMLPAGGCPGPERFDFGEHLRFVFVDPIALGRASEGSAAPAGVCPHASAEQALLALSRELDRPERRHLVLALHAPLVAAELRAERPGAAEADTREAAGDLQARALGAVLRAARPRVPILFAGGHESGLQLHRDAVGAYTLVSGAGSTSEVGALETAASALYAEAAPGYMRLDAHADGALSLSATAIRGERRETTLHHCIAEGPPS